MEKYGEDLRPGSVLCSRAKLKLFRHYASIQSEYICLPANFYVGKLVEPQGQG